MIENILRQFFPKINAKELVDCFKIERPKFIENMVKVFDPNNPPHPYTSLEDYISSLPRYVNIYEIIWREKIKVYLRNIK